MRCDICNGSGTITDEFERRSCDCVDKSSEEVERLNDLLEKAYGLIGEGNYHESEDYVEIAEYILTRRMSDD